MSKRIIIVDDHEIFCAGLATLLQETPFEVVGSFQTTQDAESFLGEKEVDLAILDVRLKSPDGLDSIEVFDRKYGVPSVIMSASDNPAYIARAYVLGARDYLVKSMDGESMTNAIGRAMVGKAPMDNSLMHQIGVQLRFEPKAEAMPKGFPLTSREAQVLRHIAYGLSNREIAISLRLSIETIKEHVQNMIRKIGAADRTDAAVRAIKAGLVE